jgi:hypothetical protein
LTYKNVSTTSDEIQLADDYIHTKLYLLYADYVTNSDRIIPERAQIVEGDDGQYVRVYQRPGSYENIVTVFISNAYKLRIVSILPETTTGVPGGYSFHDPVTLDSDLLEEILNLLKSNNQFTGKVDSLIEYRTHVLRGLNVHVVFYDEAGVLNSVEYYIDVGTNPNTITSYLTDQASPSTASDATSGTVRP